ncbi:MAG TPA: condensation domain-containing protein [Blastocatellia bacterium]|nr:condensation domain-containing protein [Blastocatellia bacterium]
MTTSVLLSQLRGLGVELSVIGGRLRYKAPKGVMTPALRAELSRLKPDLLASLNPAATVADSIPAIKPADRPELLPLSFAQEQMWFLNQMAPDDPFYNITVALRFKGELDEGALDESLRRIQARHEILRTCFPVIDAIPYQSVSALPSLRLQVNDLTHLDPSHRQAEIDRLARLQAREPFDLERGPLIRASLLRVARDERVLVLSLHHIVADGWSLAIIDKEMRAFYEAIVENREAELGELAVQYGDYALWQRERMKGEWYEQEMAYWRRKLSGGVRLVEVETDHRRTGRQSHRGGKVRRAMSGRVVEGVREVMRREKVTGYMVMLAGLEVLMSRYSGEQEVVIGTVMANRTRWEIAETVGMYANTVLMRGDLRGEPSLREVIGRVREEVIEGMEHQEVPYEKVIEQMRGRREVSRDSVIGVMFVMQERREERKEMKGIRIEEMEVEEGVAKYDIKVEVEEVGEGMVSEIEYDRELYERETIERMLEHYEKVIEVIVTDPDRRISDIPAQVSRHGTGEGK